MLGPVLSIYERYHNFLDLTGLAAEVTLSINPQEIKGSVAAFPIGGISILSILVNGISAPFFGLIDKCLPVGERRDDLEMATPTLTTETSPLPEDETLTYEERILKRIIQKRATERQEAERIAVEPQDIETNRSTATPNEPVIPLRRKTDKEIASELHENCNENLQRSKVLLSKSYAVIMHTCDGLYSKVINLSYLALHRGDNFLKAYHLTLPTSLGKVIVGSTVAGISFLSMHVFKSLKKHALRPEIADSYLHLEELSKNRVLSGRAVCSKGMKELVPNFVRSAWNKIPDPKLLEKVGNVFERYFGFVESLELITSSSEEPVRKTRGNIALGLYKIGVGGSGVVICGITSGIFKLISKSPLSSMENRELAKELAGRAWESLQTGKKAFLRGSFEIFSLPPLFLKVAPAFEEANETSFNNIGEMPEGEENVVYRVLDPELMTWSERLWVKMKNLQICCLPSCCTRAEQAASITEIV